ncbi:YDG domain-containing protein, partial [Zoogloea sp.]|uniref:YDG domain-containing protein n=1 Tax=Zoogloea sp. TaxID=49181 RepID=UPI0037DA646F
SEIEPNLVAIIVARRNSLKTSGYSRCPTVSALGKVGKWLLDPTDLTIAPSGGDLTGRVISDQLARNDVVLQSTQGASNGNGDIFVKDRISWTSGTSLSLLAGRNILINAEINASGSGAGVALNTGLFGGGQYVLGAGGRITLSGASPEFAINGENYKVIQTVAQLQAMNDNLLGRYILGTDINASATSNWNGGKGFLPIGQGASNFMGVLDGLGHQVNGLYINRPSESEVGLIGSMEATVRNIGVSGANITGLDSVGALAGQLRWGSSVSQSFASGKVTGRGNVGGLIGFATPYHYGVPYWCSQCIAIDQSYADVAVAGQGGVGGLVGTIDQTSITNSYAVGNVSSPEIVGGLVGHNWSSYIVNSYSSGQVQGQASGVGGLVGLRNGNVINSHYDSQTSGLPGGNTTAEMKQQATFSGWDFNGVWRIVEGSSYPILRALTKDKITLTVSAANETKVYNAQPWNPNPSDYISYAGFATGDNSGSLSGVLRLEGAAIGAVDAGTYGYSGAGLSSQKYEISYLPGYLTITPSPISVSGARPYDASNKAYAESVTSLNGVFERDKGLVSVTSGSGVLSGVNVGEWALSSLDTLTLGGQAAGNYRLVASGGKWAISPRPIELIGRKVYDGSTVAAASDDVLIKNLIPSDAPFVSVDTNKNGTLKSKDVGIRALEDLGSLSVSGSASSNYVLVGGAWVIAPRNLVLRANFQSVPNSFLDSMVDEYGNVVPMFFDPYKYSIDLPNGNSGLVNGDKVLGALSVAGYDRLPGVYAIVEGSGFYAGPNYSISFIPGTLSVSGSLSDAVLYSTLRVPEVIGGRVVDSVVVDPVKEIARTFGVASEVSGFRSDPVMTTLMWGSAISRIAVTGIDAYKSGQINALKSVVVGSVGDYCLVFNCSVDRKEHLEKSVSVVFDVVNSAFSISRSLDSTVNRVQSLDKSLHDSISTNFGEGTAGFFEMEEQWGPLIERLKVKELREGVFDIGREATMGAYSVFNTIFSED